MDCIFCKIANGEIKSDKVFEDKDVFAFRDINPQAPVHILLIPKKHISSLNDIDEASNDLVGALIIKVKTLAKKLNIADDGYRLVINTNHMGGQAVYHLHVHLIGGRQLSWPPG